MEVSALFIPFMPKKTYVYVDGFNLYYGSLKGTPHKWLDIRKLCEAYLQDSDIREILYFTAIVSGTTEDPDKHIRQRAYLRALETTGVRIILGHFLSERLTLPKADGSGPVEVIRSKEKGSDVNLATHLMWDAFKDHFETAVLITGDLDFLAPIRTVKSLKKEVGLLNPQRNQGSKSKLHDAATFSKPIREKPLAECQLPNELQDSGGKKIHKPPEWYEPPY